MSERIGTLNTRLTLQKRSITPDGAGGEISTWESVDTLWAAVEMMRPSRQLIAAREAQTVMAKVLLRKRSDLMPDMRFVHDGQSLVILSLFEMGDFIEVDCTIARERS